MYAQDPQQFGAAGPVTLYSGVAGETGGSQPTEAEVQVIARDSYTWAGLWVRINVNTTGAASTIRSRVAGGFGNMAVAIPAGAVGIFEDAVNSDALVDGNAFDWQIDIAAGGAMLWVTIASTLQCANDSPILVQMNRASITVGPGVTCYLSVAGNVRYGTAEGPAQYRFRTASTLSNLQLYAVSNINGAQNLRTRIGGVNGNLLITIPAGVGGWYEDAVNSDVIAPGDLVNFQLITGGALGTNFITVISMKSSSLVRQAMVANPNTPDATCLPGVTNYWTIEGDSQRKNAAEALPPAPALVAHRAVNMHVNVGNNTLNGDSTVKLRVDGGDSGLGVTVPAATAGIFEDLVNAIVLTPVNMINWQTIAGGGAGDMGMNSIGYEQEQPAAAADTPGSIVPLMVAAGMI